MIHLRHLLWEVTYILQVLSKKLSHWITYFQVAKSAFVWSHTSECWQPALHDIKAKKNPNLDDFFSHCSIGTNRPIENESCLRACKYLTPCSLVFFTFLSKRQTLSERADLTEVVLGVRIWKHHFKLSSFFYLYLRYTDRKLI